VLGRHVSPCFRIQSCLNRFLFNRFLFNTQTNIGISNQRQVCRQINDADAIS